MNTETFKGKWHQFKGKVKEKFGKLTDEEITQINGRREQLLGKLQERYGWQKQRAEEELARFESGVENEFKKNANKNPNERFQEKQQYNREENPRFKKDEQYKGKENQPFRKNEPGSEGKEKYPKRKAG